MPECMLQINLHTPTRIVGYILYLVLFTVFLRGPGLVIIGMTITGGRETFDPPEIASIYCCRRQKRHYGRSWCFKSDVSNE